MSIKEFREIEPKSSDIIPDIINFIDFELPKLAKEKCFNKNTNEDRLTEIFFIHIYNAQIHNTRLGSISFLLQKTQYGSSKVDMAVLTGYTTVLFTIEAKVLPKQKENKKAPEHDYVYAGTSSGGIQRFKKGKHGVDNNNKPLPESGVIAYIKENDFDYWLNIVNQWILQAGWRDSEKLEKIYFKSIARLISKHSRQTKQPDTPDITLHHFWVYVA
jgi:hypothetical protein